MSETIVDNVMDDFTLLELSELDQIMPRLYVRWLISIRMSGSPSKQAITDILQNGISSALEALPMLAGDVVAKSPDSSRLEVRVPRNTPEFRLRIQHLDGEKDTTLPTYKELAEAEFPVSVLPDQLLTPQNPDSLPVFDVLATFIRGGVLLCFVCHHAIVDGPGMGLLIKFLAQHCNAASNSSVAPGSIAKPSISRSILPQAGQYTGTNVGFKAAEASEPSKEPAKVLAPMTCQTFKFPAEAIQKLKTICTVGPGFITAHDALTAILYGAVSYARALRFTKEMPGTSTLPSTMGIAVNGRRRMQPPLPADYSGNVSLYATYSVPISLPVEAISDIPSQQIDVLAQKLKLAQLATLTHEAIAKIDQDFATSTIAFAASLPDVTKIVPMFSNTYQGTDFFITSAADFPVFDQEWWPGGFTDAVRIPLKAMWDGTSAVVATKDRSKGLDILLGLREDDMEVVKGIMKAFGAQVVWERATFDANLQNAGSKL